MKTTLLKIAAGPESIEIYTDDDEGIVDFSYDLPALYLIASTHDSFVKLGPFCLSSIRKQLEERLK